MSRPVDEPMDEILDLPSPNHDARPDPVDALVLHYTGMRTGKEAIDRLRDPAARVSSHYVVEEDGTVYRLVPEERRAWHAGVSRSEEGRVGEEWCRTCRFRWSPVN